MDLDTLLRDTASVSDPTPQVVAAARAALDAAILASEPGEAPAGRLSRRHSRRLGVVAIFAAAACLALVIGPTIDFGRRPAARADAARVLLRAATAAGSQPGGWPDAAYWHSVSTHVAGSNPTYRREIWIGHRASGVLKDEALDAGQAMPLEVAQFPAGARGITWDELYALPTEPRALERTLRAGIDGAGPDDDSELFTIVGDLLRESPAPPPLRRALWEVAADIPGVRLVGPVTDSAGRPGVAVERDGGYRYVLDPDSGRLLEESGGSYRATYLEQGPADEAPAATYRSPKERRTNP